VLLHEAGSTNDVARVFVERALAEGEDLPPTAVVTRRQPQGRGRAGRSWSLPEGRGLAVSLIVPWPEGPGRVRVPVLWGIALARGLSRAFGLPVRLKWPNDLLVVGRKLGGILVEARGVGKEGYAVIGIGLNVTATAEDLTGLPGATSLQLAGAPTETLVEDAPLLALLDVLDGTLGSEPGDLVESFSGVTAHAPEETLRVKDGDRVMEGRYAGITEDGFLRLETASGEKVLLSGDVEKF
jgi:biotin-[acetyl-CoA-carboxylase] ligase BirA-like protein